MSFRVLDSRAEDKTKRMPAGQGGPESLPKAGGLWRWELERNVRNWRDGLPLQR